LFTCYHHSLHHHSTAQVLANQVQHPFVPYHLRDAVHQDVVIDLVEELADVKIDYPVTSLLGVRLGRAHRVVRTTSGPKPIAMRTEARLEDGRHRLPQ